MNFSSKSENKEFNFEELTEIIKNRREGYSETIIELARSSDNRVVDFLINELNTGDDFSYREKIAVALGITQHPKAVEKLKEVMDDPSTPTQTNEEYNRWVVRGAIEGIKFASKITLPFIIEMMKKSKTEELKLNFAGTFKGTRNEKEVEVVLENFNDFNDIVKVEIGFMIQSMQIPISEELEKKRILLLKEILTIIENSITESFIPPNMLKGFRSLLIGSLYYQNEDLFPYFQRILNKEPVRKEIRKQSYTRREVRTFLESYKKKQYDLLPEEKRQKQMKLESDILFVQTKALLNDVSSTGRLLELHENTDNWDLRRLISQVIMEFLKTHDTETLIDLLNTSDFQTKIGIIHLLGLHRNEKALNTLRKIYTNDFENQKVQAKAFWAINQMETNSAYELPVSAISSKKSAIRQEAIKSILRKKSLKSPPKDKDLTNVLVEMGKEGAELICEVIDSNSLDLHVFTAGLKIIAQIGKDALEPLKESLSKESNLLKSFASLAFGEIGEYVDEETVDLLICILREKNKDYGSDAAKTLGKIGNVKAVQEMVNIFHDNSYDKDQRSEVLVALGNFEDEKLNHVYVEGLKDSYERIRRVSAINLGKTGNIKFRKHLIDIIENDENQEVRRIALGAIGFIENAEIYDYIKSILEGSKGFLQLEAAHSIGKTKDSRSLDLLFSLINDTNTDVSLKKKALLGLRELNDKKAISLLKEIKIADDSQLRDPISSTIRFLEVS